jgi:hypothetical protein
MNLPPSRQLLAARTHSRVWDGAEYGAAVKRYRRRATWFDRLCWIASGLLILGAGWLVWG